MSDVPSAIATGTGRLSSVQELWIDFLLEEEFASSPGFTQNVLDACCCPARYRLEDITLVRRSVADEFGEADIVVECCVWNADNRLIRLALLVEDKIRAAFGHEQARRYRARGEAGTGKEWDAFVTILVAPASYISRGHEFGSALELEQVGAWLCLEDPRRAAYKRERIAQAVKKSNAVGVQVVDADMTDFRKQYFDCLRNFNAENGCDFQIRPPAPTYYGDYWFELKSRNLRRNSIIRHRARRNRGDPMGDIDLTFRGVDADVLKPLREWLDPDMKLLSTGKGLSHATIRVEVAAIARFDDFQRDKSFVLAALLTAKRLLDFYASHAMLFAGVLESNAKP